MITNSLAQLIGTVMVFLGSIIGFLVVIDALSLILNTLTGRNNHDRNRS